MDSDSPIESVDLSEASSPPCWRVQLLSYRLLGKKDRAVFLAEITLSCCATWACCRRGFSLAGAATSIIFAATKVVFHDKTRLSSRQKYACRDKHILS